MTKHLLYLSTPLLVVVCCLYIYSSIIPAHLQENKSAYIHTQQQQLELLSKQVSVLISANKLDAISDAIDQISNTRPHWLNTSITMVNRNQSEANILRANILLPDDVIRIEEEVVISGEVRGVINTYINYSSFIRPYELFATRIELLLIVFTVIVSAVNTLLVYMWHNRPMQKLIEISRSISNGDLTPTEPLRTYGLFDELVDAINSMRSSLISKKQASDKQHRFNEASRSIQSFFLNRTDTAEMFHRIIRMIIMLTESEHAFLAETIEDGNDQTTLRLLSSSELPWGLEHDQANGYGYTIQKYDNILGDMLLSHKVVIDNNFASNSYTLFPAAAESPINNIILIPINNGVHLQGVLALANNNTTQYSYDLYEDLARPLQAISHIIQAIHSDQELRASKNRVNAILETAADGILLLTDEASISFLNASAVELFGLRQQNMLSQSFRTLLSDESLDDFDSFFKTYKDNLENTPESTIELIARKRSDRHFHIEIDLGHFYDKESITFTAIARDISERVSHFNVLRDMSEQLFQTNEKLNLVARTDELTGLSNRRYFDEILEKEFHRTARNNKPISLLYCDIDYFKNYNDAYGHQAGDLCLQKVSECINDCFQRASEFPARYGGEEFVVILPGIDASSAHKYADNLRHAIWDMALPHKDSEIASRVTISIGTGTLFMDKHSNADDLVRMADLALYSAKSAGRNRVESNDHLATG